MSIKKSPLIVVKDQFGSKEKLVQALIKFSPKVLDRAADEEKESLQKRLLKTSNSTLLRLHRLGTLVESKWGTKEKLVDDLLMRLNRTRDKDYRAKMLTRSVAWLHDRISPFERHSRKNVPAASVKEEALSSKTKAVPAKAKAPASKTKAASAKAETAPAKTKTAATKTK